MQQIALLRQSLKICGVINMQNMIKQWTLITIDDPDFLQSQSINKILQILLSTIEFKFVILTDIQGSGQDWAITNLKKKENKPIETSKLIEYMKTLNQIDWGDFYLFKSNPSKWKNIGDFLDYPKLISQSDTTVRAVDNQYIYIYTPHKKIIDVIKKNYKIESSQTDCLENLDYPY